MYVFEVFDVPVESGNVQRDRDDTEGDRDDDGTGTDADDGLPVVNFVVVIVLRRDFGGT